MDIFNYCMEETDRRIASTAFEENRWNNISRQIVCHVELEEPTSLRVKLVERQACKFNSGASWAIASVYGSYWLLPRQQQPESVNHQHGAELLLFDVVIK